MHFMRRIKKDKIRQFSYCFGKSTNTLIGSSIPQVQRRTTERIPDLECFKGPANTDFQDNFYHYQPVDGAIFVGPLSFVKVVKAELLNNSKRKRTRLQQA